MVECGFYGRRKKPREEIDSFSEGFEVLFLYAFLVGGARFYKLHWGAWRENCNDMRGEVCWGNHAWARKRE